MATATITEERQHDVADVVDPAYERPTAIITLRITPSLHRRLKAAAHERRTSLNLLCVAAVQDVIAAK